MLPKAFKSWPKSNQLPDLVTLVRKYVNGSLKFKLAGVHANQQQSNFSSDHSRTLFLLIFVLYEQFLQNENCRLQQDPNSYCRRRREACWPLDHHGGPSIDFVCYGKTNLAWEAGMTKSLSKRERNWLDILTGKCDNLDRRVTRRPWVRFPATDRLIQLHK